ncbi:MAG: HTH domain-containing protein [Roseibacillus sp.]|jgi:DNA-binding transcriptional regulator GbsR (MarR family)|nr:HTH domain-containing protein [Roseibacillus sp.]|tara:strand:- start:332 stop:853 length:522 start_codon:yes stop_codon:yes gene_type:complete
MKGEAAKLNETRDRFVAQWGVMGTQWGINRTMAQIHALLMTNPEPMSTDEVMEELHISRGNAHTNLKELVNWGLLRIVTRKGERKEYFEAELDVWEIFRRIVKERKRRELDPALDLLEDCMTESKGMTTAGGRAFHEQMKSLEEFVHFASKMSDRVGSMPHGKTMKLALKLFG